MIARTDPRTRQGSYRVNQGRKLGFLVAQW